MSIRTLRKVIRFRLGTRTRRQNTNAYTCYGVRACLHTQPESVPQSFCRKLRRPHDSMHEKFRSLYKLRIPTRICTYALLKRAPVHNPRQTWSSLHASDIIYYFPSALITLCFRSVRRINATYLFDPRLWRPPNEMLLVSPLAYHDKR